MVRCPSCAAGLRFDIETQRCVCEYCQGSFDPQNINDNVREDAKTEQGFEAYSYICPSCGAELVTTDKVDAIGFCHYCGGASMIFDKIRRDWKTDYVIPFTLTKEQCKQAYVKEVKRHIFVSKKYRNPELIESFRGVYMPYWSYSTGVKGEFNITVDAHTRPSPTGNITIDRYSFKGTSDFVLSGYTHDASISFDDHLSEKLAPYDVTRQKPFNPAYLCGFYAEAGDADKRKYFREAKEEMDERCQGAIIESPELQETLSRYDKLEVLNASFKVDHSKLKQTLYPVWFMSYRRGETITYATVNGQTGKVGADLPLSPLRIIIAALGVAAALFAAIWGLMNFLPSVKAAATLGMCTVLLLQGTYLLLHSFILTVERMTHAEIMSEQPPDGRLLSKLYGVLGFTVATRRYILASIAAFFSIFINASDGSYMRGLAFLFGLVFVVMLVIMAVFHIYQMMAHEKVKTLAFGNESQLRSGVVDEAQKLCSPLTLLFVLVILTTVANTALIFANLSANILYYSMCGLCAALLFAMALIQIGFQAKAAKRALPQIRKKGAYYDEK